MFITTTTTTAAYYYNYCEQCNRVSVDARINLRDTEYIWTRVLKRDIGWRRQTQSPSDPQQLLGIIHIQDNNSQQNVAHPFSVVLLLLPRVGGDTNYIWLMTKRITKDYNSINEEFIDIIITYYYIIVIIINGKAAYIYKSFPSVSQIKQQQNEYRGDHVEMILCLEKGVGGEEVNEWVRPQMESEE